MPLVQLSGPTAVRQKASKNKFADATNQLKQTLYKLQNDKSYDMKVELAHWFVHSWGGIPAGEKNKATENGYISRLCNNPIHTGNTDRIASWSKVKCIKDGTPIFDSRVACSLNLIAYIKGIDIRFFWPQGRNTHVKSCEELLRKSSICKKIQRSNTYDSYYRLAGHVSQRLFPKNEYGIHNVEMLLFSMAEHKQLLADVVRVLNS